MKNSKNIYELLNKVEFNLDDYEKQEITDIEKKNLKNTLRDKLKNSTRKRYNLKKLGSIAVALVLTVGVFSQTSFAKEVYSITHSKVSQISYSIGKALGIERDIDIYSNVVNKVVETNGIEIKLTDVIIDKEELIFSTILSTNEPIDGIDYDFNIFINGKRIKNYSGTGVSGPIDDTQSVFFQVNSVDIKEIDTEGNLDIRIELNNLSYYIANEKEGVKGKWKFEFIASGDELMANTSTLAIEYTFSIDDTDYILEEFRYNPINQKIFGKVKKRTTDSYEIDLRGYDNLGNEVIFFLNRMHDEELTFKYENIYGDLSDEITSITLVPYARKLPRESGKISGDYKQVGNEFTILFKK